jgi:hypothetical protein
VLESILNWSLILSSIRNQEWKRHIMSYKFKMLYQEKKKIKIRNLLSVNRILVSKTLYGSCKVRSTKKFLDTTSVLVESPF